MGKVVCNAWYWMNDIKTRCGLTKESSSMQYMPQSLGWQLCPKCCGQMQLMGYICDVCYGEKIINIESGLPPSKHIGFEFLTLIEGIRIR